MSWTALVPLKHRIERKSRLAGSMAADARALLSECMFDHVIGVLGTTPAIRRIVLLSPAAPENWPHDWIRDERRGLNAELAAFQSAERASDLLIIHADLPLLARADVEALLDAAVRTGTAIAPDRHDRGTNALACRAGMVVEPRFGPDSFALHRRSVPEGAIIRREGLALDVDTPEDLELVEAAPRWRIPGGDR
ncbi:2-phospho-L-lactate guanylyltransferase [Sphingomonas oligophenolica]|uniref:2-phospho-L-lactate guanylyltransferase n=1 Tax=Sphingomonas oligophenolica TaxID=301154 RepID=A0ABU9Y2A9_9SPHN